MTVIPYLVAYLAVLVFVVAVIARFIMWSKLPMHLRWELYPVAHEGKRASYGGSYLEEVDWWKKRRHSSLMGELKVMVPEILFLVALWEHNRKMWIRSFPFHFGIYLVAGATFVMVVHGALAALAPAAIAGGLGAALARLTVSLAASGLALGMIGALGLLHRRLTNEDLKDFTTPADIFNLALFVVVFGVALGHIAAVDRDLSRSMAFVGNLVTFNLAPLGGQAVWLTGLSAVLLGGLLAYIPLTHMSHFVGKYFSYHSIRWGDEPNLRGGKYEAKIQELLNQPVSWAGPHIQGGGKKTWVQLATEEMKKPEPKKKSEAK
jgi:nitrate reductase gamma subunit